MRMAAFGIIGRGRIRMNADSAQMIHIRYPAGYAIIVQRRKI